MENLSSKESIEEAISSNDMVLLYFGKEACWVSRDLKPKVIGLIKKYPKIKSYYIDLNKSDKLVAEYNMFTTPGILLYIHGKETIREARHISIGELENKIDRYYNLLY